jgi:mannose-6-phosphate isomerase-like protein (cupin superfamily)
LPFFWHCAVGDPGVIGVYCLGQEENMIKTNQRHIDYRELCEEIGQSPAQLARLKETGDYTGMTKSVKTVLDGRNRAAAISSPGGAPSDPHLHADFHEWWIIMGGEVAYEIGEYEQIVASFGDIVIAPCGYRHDIKPWKGDQCIRMVVGLEDSNHDLKGLPHLRTLPIPGDWEPPNMIHTSLDWMIERHGLGANWGEEVVLDQRNRVNVIHTLPGSPNRPHWHPDMDEWWFVAKGEIEWQVGGDDPFVARRGDIVFVGAGYSHAIRTVGDESSIRYAVTSPDVVHHFLDDEDAPRPPKS